jgi:predicted flap endonuclease-1-like 5' DNA nuclease
MNRSWLPFVFLLAFVLVCIISVSIYVHSVKGIAFFAQPSGSGVWLIIEILLALLLTVLIGLGMGWILREPTIKHLSEEGLQLKTGIHQLTSEREELLRSQSQTQQQLHAGLHQQAQRYEQKIARLESENKQLAGKPPVVIEKTETSAELDVLKFKVRQLEFELEEARQKKSQEPVIITKVEKPKVDIEFLHESLSHLRDDLKVIKGIGPVIEKKLNEQGIYTFQQIAEFSDDEIGEVSTLLEFFPGRIQRDRWVAQAQALYLQKSK